MTEHKERTGGEEGPQGQARKKTKKEGGGTTSSVGGGCVMCVCIVWGVGSAIVTNHLSPSAGNTNQKGSAIHNAC